MISNYEELVAAVGDWLDRDDLVTRAGTFIQLAESRLNRLLDDPLMEATVSGTASSDYTALPDDFGSMISISTGTGNLTAVGAAEYAGYPAVAGDPRAYAIVGDTIAFAPRNTSTPYTLVYRRRIPSLTAEAPANWLLTLAPDVYLYGALLQAEAFLGEDNRVSMWKSAFDEAISDLVVDATKRKWGAGPIAPRIRRA